MKRELSDYSKGAQKILQEAERLFAEHGVNGVSVRQIHAAAGQANKSAVQYFFKSKEGLVQAIYDLRQNQLEVARTQWFSDFGTGREPDAEDLLAGLLLPILDSFDRRAQDIFAKFVMQLMVRRWDDPVFAHDGELETNRRITTRLRAIYAHLPDAVFWLRYRLVVILFLNAITQRELVPAHHHASDDIFWGELLQDIVAIYDQPFPPRRQYPVERAAPKRAAKAGT